MAAWLLDIILLCVVAVGVAYLLSAALGYDKASAELESHYARYESRYGVVFDITQEAYEAMTDQERAAYDTAYEALIADADVLYTYDLVINLTLLITSLSILVATMGLEFCVPLLLKNGQTIGKKCFSLCVVRIDGVKVNNMQMFARTILGKYTIEKMIPVYIILMLLWGTIGLTGTLILLILLVTQIICVAVGQNRAAIHDRLAGTVVVDIASQQIFASTEDRIAYIKRIHEDQAKRQTY